MNGGRGEKNGYEDVDVDGKTSGGARATAGHVQVPAAQTLYKAVGACP